MLVLYNVDKGDVFWAASDVGWVVGHSYIVLCSLLRGCTTIVFEGKPIMTPDAGAFWRIVKNTKSKPSSQHRRLSAPLKRKMLTVNFFGQYDLSKLVAIFSAGERLDPPTQEWLHGKNQANQ